MFFNGPQRGKLTAGDFGSRSRRRGWVVPGGWSMMIAAGNHPIVQEGKAAGAIQLVPRRRRTSRHAV